MSVKLVNVVSPQKQGLADSFCDTGAGVRGVLSCLNTMSMSAHQANFLLCFRRSLLGQLDRKNKGL